MKYHKINALYKRNMQNNGKLLYGEWCRPEFDLLKDIAWVATEKIDGTNIRVYHENGSLRIEGRKENSQIPAHLLQKIESIFGQVDFDIFNGKDVCLYGEGYGTKIQNCGDKYINGQTSFILFDVTVNGIFLEWKDVQDVAEKLNINVVPEIMCSNLICIERLVAQGFDSRIAETPFTAEGVVVRPLINLYDKTGERIISKIKHHDYSKLLGTIL